MVGLLIGRVSEYRVDKLRASGPELQSVEIHAWDSIALREFKMKYNTRVEAYKLTSSTAQAGLRRSELDKDYLAELERIRSRGSEIEVREANLLNDAFDLWRKVEQKK